MNDETGRIRNKPVFQNVDLDPCKILRLIGGVSSKVKPKELSLPKLRPAIDRVLDEDMALKDCDSNLDYNIDFC